MLPRANQDLPELSAKRSNEFLVLGLIAVGCGVDARGSIRREGVQAAEFFLDLSKLGRVSPDPMPVSGLGAVR